MPRLFISGGKTVLMFGTCWLIPQICLFSISGFFETPKIGVLHKACQTTEDKPLGIFITTHTLQDREGWLIKGRPFRVDSDLSDMSNNTRNPIRCQLQTLIQLSLTFPTIHQLESLWASQHCGRLEEGDRVRKRANLGLKPLEKNSQWQEQWQVARPSCSSCGRTEWSDGEGGSGQHMLCLMRLPVRGQTCTE